jgi:hypothetical protein
MKQRLLLYITSDRDAARNAVAATLAWATERAGWLFEVYYDAYRLGEHYGGGDPDTLAHGLLTGGTLIGAHHHERLYLLLHKFDTLVITQGAVAFDAALRQIGPPRIAPTSTDELYERAFSALNVDFPATAIIVDSAPLQALAGIDAYSYPEIVARRSLGFEASSFTDQAARWLVDHGVRELNTLWLGQRQRERIDQALAPIQGRPGVAQLDGVSNTDSFQSVTERAARRWRDQFSGGWILADPLTVSAWLPEAVRERRLAIYGKPQREIIRRLSAEMSASDSAVLGRQYEDADFFDLSALGVAFQLIDPGRPPFPVLQRAAYDWASAVISSSPNPLEPVEPDDRQLAQWARENRVLASLIFWTGMIRELENLPRILDLVALTRLFAGIALTVPALEYQPEAPLELLRVPIEQGGVYPHLEMLLASCGMGAAIESRMPSGRLSAYLTAANQKMDELRIPHEWRPTGWWTTMDPDMIPLPRPRMPVTPTLSRQAPFIRLRYASSTTQGASRQGASTKAAHVAEAAGGAPMEHGVSRKQRVGAWARSHGLGAALAPYRPYELFAPGDVRADVMDAARAAGMRYVFSKAGFGDPPRVLALHDDFIAMNYTAGRWDGWTPFETINDIHDLRSAERRLLARRKPGWLVSTLDSCLWTFTGPIWQRGAALFDMVSLLAKGGDSGRLINVTPRVVARYARIVAESRGSVE